MMMKSLWLERPFVTGGDTRRKRTVGPEEGKFPCNLCCIWFEDDISGTHERAFLKYFYSVCRQHVRYGVLVRENGIVCFGIVDMSAEGLDVASMRYHLPASGQWNYVLPEGRETSDQFFSGVIHDVRSMTEDMVETFYGAKLLVSFGRSGYNGIQLDGHGRGTS